MMAVMAGQETVDMIITGIDIGPTKALHSRLRVAGRENIMKGMPLALSVDLC